ncbi:hypothetical protein J3Q64DRAFT_1738688 [Phycomyces blakesleeanus]|uniref:Uncharacterized protein n=2 Tax=Phycomyces blakesleeanus TaxID=4837 RepID=A0A167NCC0_PHYB8|nr:hypothetical protein PHYBLDRAFT_158445 [Phycomyces blakesleeanus NRRL 1555(-)]OAD75658.1 hypothetical protein PHYBLDRAFT_158445 [Phycomyces blakesleeanus NRRL 1555(-)]|eukprot:XP_018293698.1 hypothetical protein PHYBLDRAFT_158445 [Phycomyces blakesleeanus NRRL 1555(-)]
MPQTIKTLTYCLRSDSKRAREKTDAYMNNILGKAKEKLSDVNEAKNARKRDVSISTQSEPAKKRTRAIVQKTKPKTNPKENNSAITNTNNKSTKRKNKRKATEIGVPISIPSKVQSSVYSSIETGEAIPAAVASPYTSTSLSAQSVNPISTVHANAQPEVIEVIDNEPIDENVLLETVDPSSIEQKTLDRISRSRDEHMMVVLREMIEPFYEMFAVLGSGVNVYNVYIGRKMSCTCFDHRMRRTMCKHIIMVLLKVFRLPSNSIIFLGRGVTQRQIEAVFETRIPDVSVSDYQSQERLKTAIPDPLKTKVPPQRRSLDTSDCPICFEEFEEETITTVAFCWTCGNNIHEVCFDMWKKSRHGSVTCVFCRSKWRNGNLAATKNTRNTKKND